MNKRLRMNFWLMPVLLVASLGVQAGGQPVPSMEEMWRIIQKQQAEIDVLRRKLNEAEAKADAAVAAAETAGTQVAKSASWAEKTSIGGYGELHYNDLQGEGGAADKDQIDFHRFVLFFRHNFTERLRLITEVELEHALAGEGKPGEVELEQAYVEYDLNDKHRVKGGVFLIPVGILNETHEPPTFYGVERNPIEGNIIPTTWWAGGAAVSGELLPGLSYDLAIHEGLATNNTGTTFYKVRSGRQKTANASAKQHAYTGRLKYTGIRGLELATTIQRQDDITQVTDPAAGAAMLYEAHAILNKGAFGLRALYAHWDLDGVGPESVGADVQKGWYFEPSWRFSEKFGVFARYNRWDNQAGSNAGVALDSGKKQYDVGFNYWLHSDVVLKLDYQHQDNENGANQDGLNLGIGYQF